jgi:hypothetical protein
MGTKSRLNRRLELQAGTGCLPASQAARDFIDRSCESLLLAREALSEFTAVSLAICLEGEQVIESYAPITTNAV